MSNWDRCRAVGRSVLVIGLMMQSAPMAWAQLATADPALHAAVEALVAADPEVAGDPELAQLCRTVAEATVTDIRERVAVTTEVAGMQREGVDINTVIPREVRKAAREQFTKMQGERQKELETLRAVDPEKAKEVELMMREGERTMKAFESGERYVPSTEMVTHAREMFNNWESDMMARGAPQEFVDRARMEMARFSSGEGMMFGGGPGHEFGGPTGGQMPSTEQMQAMGMTADQIQAAQTAMEQGHASGGSNYGINPATGGWEPGMGGAHVGTTDFSAGFGNPESWATTDWSAGGGTTYGGGTTDWSAGGGTSTGGWESTSTGGTTTSWEGTHTETYTTTTDSQQAAQERQAEIVAHARISTHTVEADGHAEEHWDGNGDNIPDHTHPIGTAPH